MIKVDDLVIPSNNENILLIDNGCDISIISNNSFLINTYTGIHFNVDGALYNMKSNNLQLVNDCYTVAILPLNKLVLLKLNQCLLDKEPSQHESLLQPHQARAFGVVVNDVAKRHPEMDGKQGGQCICIDTDTLPLHFDGLKCFLHIRKPSPEEIKSLPVYELTSPHEYKPQSSVNTTRLTKAHVEVGVQDWRKRLGYPTFETTKATLAVTSQMVTTLQAESREYLRDYYKTRVWCLRPRRIDDVMYSDTFFSSVISVRNFSCFQLFAFKASKFTKSMLMSRESQAPEKYEDIIRHYGAPNKTVTDNARVCTGKRWTKINRKYCIETGLSVPHHQNQNYAEGEGGNMKFRILKLFHNTPHAPLPYWCYAMEFLDQVGCYLSKPSLDGRTASETLVGQTPDISIFRFAWFQPVWYYNPTLSFPQDKMSPGSFLKITENTGDGFAYHVLPAKDITDIPRYRSPVVLVRCVVRPRNLSSSDAPRCSKDVDGFKFTNANGDELFADVEDDTNLAEQELVDEELSRSQQMSDTSTGLHPVENHTSETEHSHSQTSASLLTLDVDLPTILEEQEDEAMHDCPVTEEHTQSVADQEITSVVGPPDDTISPSPHVPIISQTPADVEDDPPSDDDTGLNDLILEEGTDLDTMAAHINAQLDETDDVLSAELEAIVDHRYLSGIIEFQVKYTNGDLSWHPIDLIKDENPHCVAVYVINNDLGKISNGIHRRWARTFLRALKRTIRRMKKVDFNYIESSTYDPVVSKKARRHVVKRARRAQAGKPIPVPPKGKRTFKHGLEVPKNWKDIKRIDDAAGNTRWQDAVEKEVAALIMHKCFDFKTPDYKPPTDYQFCRLHLVYDIKNDLTYKARLVCNGSQVDPRGLSTRATVVKSISVRILDLIADAL